MLATHAGCELDVERGPDWLLVRLRGLEVDPASPPPLADELWALAQRHFTYRIVLELDRIELLDSYLVGQLIRLYKKVHEHDGVLRLCGLSPYNCRVLQICALADRLPVFDCREDAIMGGFDPRMPR